MEEGLIRISSIDEIEQPGILYRPDNDTNKIVIHVHGLNGNFYEDRFLDTVAKAYTNQKYDFLTFNNRGKGFINELLKGNDCMDGQMPSISIIQVKNYYENGLIRDD